MRQADIFLASEGDAWLARNRGNLGAADPVSEAIEKADIKPRRVLEIGCANGWRLAALRDKYGCEVYGVEPSHQACFDAGTLRVPVQQATAERLPISSLIKDYLFDVVIYGFCLYLTDPADWFRIVAEGDRVLADSGHLIIHDFSAQETFARRYTHRDGLLAYHVPFRHLWLAHPLYRPIRRRDICGPDTEVIILKKEPASTIEVRP